LPAYRDGSTGPGRAHQAVGGTARPPSASIPATAWPPVPPATKPSAPAWSPSTGDCASISPGRSPKPSGPTHWPGSITDDHRSVGRCSYRKKPRPPPAIPRLASPEDLRRV